jgi:hypothetical protein
MSFSLIEYVPVERTRDIVVLHFKATILSVASFLCFAIYSTYIFVLSPVPVDFSSEIIFANTTNSALFQFSVSTFENTVTCGFDPNQVTYPPLSLLNHPPLPLALSPPVPPPHSRRLFDELSQNSTEPPDPGPPGAGPSVAPSGNDEQYFFPLSNKLVRDPKKLKTTVTGVGVFDSYKFPIFGTMDARSLTSFVVVIKFRCLS